MSNSPRNDGIDHYIKALELAKAGKPCSTPLGQIKEPVSLEEARELLAAVTAEDPVCPTMEHLHRVFTTLVDVLKDGPTLESRSEAARERLREEILSEWFQKLARISYENPPVAFDKSTWGRIILTVMDRLRHEVVL